MTGQIVSLTNVSKSIPEQKRSVLSQFDLQANGGQMLGLCGPSGCGKTTVLNIIAGLEQPDAGTVRLFDTDLSSLVPRERVRVADSFRRRWMGIVPQNLGLLGYMTAQENVMLALLLTDTPYRRAKAIADAYLHEVGLGDHTRQRVMTLSGGQQQRVAVVRALCKQPRLILADEPGAHLDRENRLLIYQRLRQHALQGAAVLVAAHDDDLLSYCDSYVFLPHEVAG